MNRLSGDHAAGGEGRFKTVDNLQSIVLPCVFEAVPRPLKSPGEQAIKNLRERGGELASGDAVDVVFAWQSSPAGHVEDIVLP